MSDLFRSYEEEFVTAMGVIDRRLAALSQQTNPFNDLKADLSECDKGLKLMQTEIASMTPQNKIQNLRKIRQYKRDYDNARKALHKQEEDYAFAKSKEMLLGAQLEGVNNQRLLRNGQTLVDGNNNLKQSVLVMHDSLQMSTNIGQDLQEHSGKLIRNVNKLSLVRGDLTRSQRLIKRMMLRIKKNKFVLASVLGLIFLVTIIILGIHFGKDTSTPNPTPTN